MTTTPTHNCAEADQLIRETIKLLHRIEDYTGWPLNHPTLRVVGSEPADEPEWPLAEVIAFPRR